MANTKISELSAVTALAGTDVFPVVDVSASTTNKVSVEDLLRNAPDGSAGAPSIANAGDQDTGILFPAANSVGVSTGGTQRLVIDSSGRVGIGTSSPSTRFHLTGTDSNFITLAHATRTGSWIINHSGTNSENLEFQQNNGSTTVRSYLAGRDVHEFHTNGSERMRIDSSGNVGIGTASPGANLHISSTGDTIARVTSADGNGAFLDLGDASDPDGGRIVYDSGSNLAFSTASTERLRIDSSGRLLVGTSSTPDADYTSTIAQNGPQGGALYLSRNLNANQILLAGYSLGTIAVGTRDLQAARITCQSDATGTASSLAGRLVFSTTASGASTPTERLRIDSSGRLGLGSSSPLLDFQVVDYGGFSGNANQLLLNNNTYYDSGDKATKTGFSTRIDLTNQDGSIRFLNTSSSSSANAAITLNERMRIDSSGRVMIGTTTNNGGSLTVDSGLSSNIAIRDDAIENHKTNGNGSVSINYNGYQNGTTQFRDLVIYNGKQGHIATFDGSTSNILLGGTTSPASATKSLAIFNGTAPTGSVANGVVLYAEDVSSSSELKVRDEAGNVTTLSPHNFDLIPEGPSEDMAWSYYSEKDGKRINVDMLKAVRLLEQLTGEQLVFTG